MHAPESAGREDAFLSGDRGRFKVENSAGRTWKGHAKSTKTLSCTKRLHANSKSLACQPDAWRDTEAESGAESVSSIESDASDTENEKHGLLKH